MHTVKKITDPRTQGQYSINKKDLKVLKDYYKRFKRTQTEDFDVIDKVINKLLKFWFLERVKNQEIYTSKFNWVSVYVIRIK